MFFIAFYSLSPYKAYGCTGSFGRAAVPRPPHDGHRPQPGREAVTRSEALAEARKRWGTMARIEKAVSSGNGHYLATFYRVGGGMAHHLAVFGEGKTWEAAFADAERRRDA